MNKEQYLEILKKRMKNVDKDEKKDILNEYESHFISGYKDNKDDTEIIKKLGDPVKISKEINAMTAINRVEKEKNIKNIFIAAFSIMSLSIFNFISIIFSFFVLLLLLPLILAYVIAVPIMIVSPIILLVIGVINGFDTISMNDIFEVIKGVILGIILGFIGYFVAKYFLNFVVLYLKWRSCNEKIFYFRIIDFFTCFNRL